MKFVIIKIARNGKLRNLQLEGGSRRGKLKREINRKMKLK